MGVADILRPPNCSGTSRRRTDSIGTERMSQRCHDIFAWWRTFMSPVGPAPITRLVLCGHLLFMDRDGSRCVVGVRRLADITGLNKDTVAEHRTMAVTSGWLILSERPTTSRCREIYPAIPDQFSQGQRHPLSSVAGQSMSSRTGQSGTIQPSRLSGLGDATVRFQPSDCPAPPDLPLIPLLPLRSGNLEAKFQTRSKPTDPQYLQNRRRSLEAWLLTSQTAQRYRHDIDSLVRLVPLDFRFQNYEDFIRLVIDRHSCI